MKRCQKCSQPMRENRKKDVCKSCLEICHCGNRKNHQAAECMSCGMRRKMKVQWVEKRDVMITSIRTARKRTMAETARGVLRPTGRKFCTKCSKRMRADRASELCKSCASICHCGKSKDFRAVECISCGMSRKAKAQWQEKRDQMLVGMKAAAVRRYENYVKIFNECSIDGCGRKAEARGWCHTHYEHWRKSGNPVSVRLTPEERFWSQVNKTDGCWLWIGRLNEHGYGVIGIGKKRVRAHRYSYFLANGKWPEPCGRHTCDTPPCVRPDHVVEGDQYENMKDRTNRGRDLKGEQVGTSKLTQADVRQIKAMLAAGVQQKSIAAKFGIQQNTVSRIHTGLRWKHLSS